MKVFKWCISVFVFFGLLIGISPILVFAQNEDLGNTIIEVGNAEELVAATSNLQGGETISLINNIEFTRNITFSKDVTLVGNGYEIYFPLGGDGNHINVINGATVNLGKMDGSDTLILRGPNKQSQTGPAFIAVSGASTINMYNGVTVKDYINNNYFGGGVTLTKASTFHMYGGIIENCGINGGSVNHGGGVFVGQGSSFIMKNGAIENCRASSNGGGVSVVASSDSYYNNGRQWGFLDSHFTMLGGSIRNNTAQNYVGGGVAVLGTYIQAQGMVAPTPGSGAPDNPGVFILGGNIENNKAQDGGGLFLNWIRPTVEIKNCHISDNEANDGGGISILSEWTQSEIENCTITNNVASFVGGGIKLIDNTSSYGTLLMDCVITENTTGADGVGAGVYYDKKSKLLIRGKNVIQNNKKGDKLNNLNILDLEHPVYVVGSLDNSLIGLSDTLLHTDGIEDRDTNAISLERLTSGYQEHNSNLSPYQVFTSDHETWYADCGFNTKETIAEETGSDYSTEIRLVRTTYTLHYNDGISENKTDFYVPTSPSVIELPSRDGYVFKGWYDNKDFSGEPAPKTPTSNQGDVDYYAKWELVYSITYELDGGTISGDYPTTYLSSDGVAALPIPTKEGYTFEGWYETADFSGSAISKIDAGSTGNKTYYVKWIKEKEGKPFIPSKPNAETGNSDIPNTGDRSYVLFWTMMLLGCGIVISYHRINNLLHKFDKIV